MLPMASYYLPHVWVAGALSPTGPSLFATDAAPAVPFLNLTPSAKPVAPAPPTLPTPSADLPMMHQNLPPPLPKRPVPQTGRTPEAGTSDSMWQATGDRATEPVNIAPAAGKIFRGKLCSTLPPSNTAGSQEVPDQHQQSHLVQTNPERSTGMTLRLAKTLITCNIETLACDMGLQFLLCHFFLFLQMSVVASCTSLLHSSHS